ncbi:MAG: hypothetical protein M3066_15145 [Actinomycetota bacterium]|nr:hypothetical protein [Actinomycetota bacterium]
MTWQVFVRAAAESDLEKLSEGDRDAVASEMFAWVEAGPPRSIPRDVMGVGMFDDKLRGGFRVTYVVDEDHERILVVRIRKSTGD